jgi:hypothetical protein
MCKSSQAEGIDRIRQAKKSAALLAEKAKEEERLQKEANINETIEAHSTS